MKWLTVASVLCYLCRHSDAGALKCSPDSKEPRCMTENRDISPAQSLIERGKETETGDAECLAGSEWESNCHYCRCSDTGVAECLKADTCDYSVIAEPIKCKPNTTFERECNVCTCLENGLGICTLRGCLPTPVHRRKRDSECEPGATWKNDCNNCLCTPTGHAMCSKKGCITEPYKSNLEKRDTQPVNELNPSRNRDVRAVQEAAKTCQSGQEFRIDCNTCLCNDDGHDFSCTRNDCAAQNNNGGDTGARTKRDTSEKIELECSPGSVFDRECNVCRCTEDGKHATCTIKRCKHTVEDNEPTPSFRCTPGDQYKTGCNDCTCSADGKNVFCTLRLCDEV